MGTFQYRNKVCSFDFVFILEYSVHLNKWHLGDLNVVLSNNSPTFDPLPACLLLCRALYLLILVASARGVQGQGEGFDAESLHTVLAQTGAHYSFLFVRIMYLADRSHTLIVCGALTLNLQRTKTFWSSLKNWLRKKE